MNKFMHNLNNYDEPNEPDEPKAQNKLNIYKKAVKDFFKKNRSLVFLLPMLVIMIIVLIVLYSTGNKASENTGNYTVSGNKNQTESLSGSPGKDTNIPSGNKVEVLPQTERSADKDNENEGKKNESNPVNPFDAPMKLSGVIVNSDKDSVAIIETSIKSYVVREGELVNDIWKVSKIEEKGVLLINGDEEKYLTIQK